MQSLTKNSQTEKVFSAELYTESFPGLAPKPNWQERPELQNSRFVIISLDLVRSLDFKLEPLHYDHLVFNFQYDEDITSDDIATFIRLKSIARENDISYTCIGMGIRCIQFLELLGIDHHLEFVN